MSIEFSSGSKNPMMDAFAGANMFEARITNVSKGFGSEENGKDDCHDDTHSHSHHHTQSGRKEVDFVEDMLDSQKAWQHVYLGVFEPYFEMVKEDRGFLFQMDVEGRSVLHWASAHDNLNAITAAVNMGLPVDVPCRNTLQTPIIWAASKGNIASIKLLLSLGADKFKVDSKGVDAILQAVQQRKLLSVYYLLSQGYSLDSSDYNGCTCAHWAAFVGFLPVLNMLSSEQINAKDKQGMTPLHRAVDGNQINAVEQLISMQDCLLNVKDLKGHTALDKASEKGRTDIEMLLMNAGAYGSGLFVSPSTTPAAIRQLGLAKCYGPFKRVINRLHSFARHKLANAAMQMIYAFGSFIVGYSIWSILPATSFLKDEVVLLLKATFIGLQVLYLLVTFSNPGVIDRKSGKGQIQALLARVEKMAIVENQAKKDVMSSKQQEQSQSLFNGGDELQMICYVCEIVSPPRSKHCRVCKACISKFDHHCIWINNCIGAFNLRIFLLFLLQMLVVSYSYLATSVFVLYQLYFTIPVDATSFHYITLLCSSYPILVLCVLCAIYASYLSTILFFQTLQVVISNLTTYENMNGLKFKHFWNFETLENGLPTIKFNNPYDKGWRANAAEFLFPMYGEHMKSIENV